MSKVSYLQYLNKLGYHTPPFVVLDQIENFNVVAHGLSKSKHFAVRSSANLEDSTGYSFAGIFDTYLNIPYKLLPEYTSKVFDFSKNERLSSYLDSFKLDISHLRMEVLVQEMINCEKAGVAFSQNPVYKTPEIYIEAIWGLGKQCVSGKSSCDKIKISGNNIISYEVEFQDIMSVCDRKGGLAIKNVELIKQSKRKFLTKEIITISEMMERLSKCLSFDFEIEWGFAEGCLYLFQLRPITT